MSDSRSGLPLASYTIPPLIRGYFFCLCKFSSKICIKQVIIYICYINSMYNLIKSN